jgi:hypothetical protein
MPDWISRYVSIDDLLSVGGYVLLLTVNSFTKTPLPVASVSLLASGMLAIVWLLARQIRERNAERHPNARVVFWAAVALGSVLATMR